MRDSVCIIVGDQDKLMHVGMCQQQAIEYRQCLARMLEPTRATQSLAPSTRERKGGLATESTGGVRLVVVEGAGHHLQNDVQQEIGAQMLLQFVRDC